ncbi:MAG: Zinc transporter, family [Gemmatimonadetes bacterium]|jgi:ZIP family zinc transporter|nr:Zinc transporter, family [Gemmatimonadota bacterium]
MPKWDEEGGILATLADMMLPEVYQGGHEMVGLMTVAGFLAAFVLAKLG